MAKKSMIPRSVAFGPDGKAVAAGNPATLYAGQEGYTIKGVNLPSEHYDFIDYDVTGKTEEEIREDLEPKPLDLGFALFNVLPHEQERASKGFIRRFGKEVFQKKIQPIVEAGIMAIFHKDPDEHTLWFAETIAFIVNERYAKESGV